MNLQEHYRMASTSNDCVHHRIERDSMGDIEVPVTAFYGAQTARAMGNFPISRIRPQRAFIRALGLIKAAAANTNGHMGELDTEDALAIENAAMNIANGDYDSHFVVDVFQTGSGTSTNMNANEVIARLCASCGRPVHPNDHVNRNQSSNDVIPAAIHVSAAMLVRDQLIPALHRLRCGLTDKSRTFRDIVKIGRTHLQDAVPMRLGDEFSGYARQVEASIRRVQAAADDGIYELPLGGTAIGSGLNAPPDFGQRTAARLAEWTGLPFCEAANHFEAQAAKDAVCFLSGALRTTAVSLTKIANDIRWLASGPRCGLGELQLPPVQPGSSIMPGKINPVIAESLLMACAQVVGHDAAITWCCAAGQFELNVMMPLIAYDLIDSIELISNAASNFQDKCIRGLTADRERAAWFAERSLANVTSLVPHIGYDRAASIAKEAHRSGRALMDVAREMSGLDPVLLSELLSPASQCGRSAKDGSGHHSEELSPDEKVELMSEQSFPASDPPAY
jgi:fumarate hydratase class II